MERGCCLVRGLWSLFVRILRLNLKTTRHVLWMNGVPIERLKSNCIDDPWTSSLYLYSVLFHVLYVTLLFLCTLLNLSNESIVKSLH